jgi:hypothetical protein
MITFTFLGRSEVNRGFKYLLKTVIELHKLNALTKMKFQIQFDIDSITVDSKKDMSLIEDFLMVTSFENVYLFRSPLSNDTYRNLIETTDIGICVYDPIRYRYSTSGVSLEFMSKGIPLISSNGTWTSNFINSFNSGIITDFNCYTQSIFSIERDFKKYKENSYNLKMHLLDYNNPTNYLLMLKT